MASRKSKDFQRKSRESNLGIIALAALLIILLPLLFSTKTIDPVISIRLTALNWMLIVLTVLWFWLYSKQKFDSSYLRKPVFAIFALYLIVTAISILFSANAVAGFFDLSKTFLSLQLLVVATGIMLSYRSPEIIITKAAVVNILIGGSIGIIQYFYFIDIDTATGYFANLYSIGGLMGHKNQFAVSLFLLLPFSIYGLIAFKKYWMYLSLTAATLIMVNFALLQTRSVWVAFWAWLFFAASILVIKKRFRYFDAGTFGKMRMAYGLGLVLVIAVFVIIVQPRPAREVLRYKIISLINPQSAQNTGRIAAWGATMDMIKKHPITGVGAGNWKVQIPAFYSEMHGTDFKNWHQPHNDFLWVLSEKGLPGMLLYLLIFFMLFRFGFQIIRTTENKQHQIFFTLLTAALAGYLVIAFVDFPYDRINHQVMLIILFSLVVSQHHRLANKRAALSKSTLILLLALMLLLLPASQFYACNFFRVQKEIKQMYDAIEREDVKGVLSHATAADSPLFSLDHNANPVKMHKGTALLRLNRFDESLEVLMEAMEQHPNHPNILNNIATIYAIQGKYSEAINYFERAYELFPRNQLTIRSLSRAYFETGNYEVAYRMLLLHDTHIANKQVLELKKQIEERLND